MDVFTVRVVMINYNKNKQSWPNSHKMPGSRTTPFINIHRSKFREMSLCIWRKPPFDELSGKCSGLQRLDFMTRLETSFPVLESYSGPDFDITKCSCLSIQVCSHKQLLLGFLFTKPRSFLLTEKISLFESVALDVEP